MATDAWGALFPSYSVKHLPHGFSDHYSILLSTGMVYDRMRHSHFRFEAARLLEDSCENKVGNLWIASVGNILKRLRAIGLGLNWWFEKLKKERSFARKDLEQRLAYLCDQYPSNEVLGEMVETKLFINREMDCEELYREQRAGASWLKNGDRNTPFFHNFATDRMRRNRIYCLFNLVEMMTC